MRRRPSTSTITTTHPRIFIPSDCVFDALQERLKGKTRAHGSKF
jgi:hypothetical protein